MNLLQPHPLSRIPPPLTPEEDLALEESLLKNGQLQDITLLDGMILDGNHKYKHLIKHGITPRFKEFYANGCQTPEDYVVALLQGRNLSVSQRACVAAIITEKTKKSRSDHDIVHVPREKGTKKEEIRLKNQNRTSTKVSNLLGIGYVTTTKALVLLRHSKEYFDLAYHGKASVECCYAKYRNENGMAPCKRNNSAWQAHKLKFNLNIPNCFSSREDIDTFIKSMNSKGWILEMRFKDGKIYANWFGNGFPAIGNWSLVHNEFEFKRAVIVAANDKKDKLK